LNRIQPLILLCSLLLAAQSGFSQPEQAGRPLIHLTMDNITNPDTGNDSSTGESTVTGISGTARCFSKAGPVSHWIVPDPEHSLSEIWHNGDFSVALWVQTKARNEEFQVIAANKEWNSGEIKDFTDNRYFGFSRTSGVNRGWAIVCQPDGSWAWNIGDGEYRKDYRPTAPRQQINDGEWHQIVFTINREQNEARLYFDGINVGIYYMGPVKNLNSGQPICLGSDPQAQSTAPSFEGAIDEFEVYDHILSARDIARKYQQFVPAAKLPRLSAKPVDTLNLMAWNIWHGGRRHGREIGPKQVIDFIRDTGTDIVMMQETYGSGALIADALGYYFYLASANISVISRFPIEKTWIVYHDLRVGVTTLRLSEQQRINLASLWIHYLPDWRNDSRAPGVTSQKLIAGEGETRHKEIETILERMAHEINATEQIPLIIGGDFNSPSHRDWVPATADWHNGLTVEWPVSRVMHDAGFIDSFRLIHPSLDHSAPTMTAEELTRRIDYIYYKGSSLKAIDSDMHFKYKGIWPSDHPAVTTTMAFE